MPINLRIKFIIKKIFGIFHIPIYRIYNRFFDSNNTFLFLIKNPQFGKASSMHPPVRKSDLNQSNPQMFRTLMSYILYIFVDVNFFILSYFRMLKDFSRSLILTEDAKVEYIAGLYYFINSAIFIPLKLFPLKISLDQFNYLVFKCDTYIEISNQMMFYTKESLKLNVYYIRILEFFIFLFVVLMLYILYNLIKLHVL